MHFRFIFIILFFFIKYAAAQSADTRIQLADPTIFEHSGVYYLYGTGSNPYQKGFIVYTSKDLVNWDGPKGAKNGYALMKGDAFGTEKFWAPQVFQDRGKFYMAYTANEHIAIASSSSLLGPFTQKNPVSLIPDQKQIDPFIFFDDDGKKYLYHVIVGNGANRIFVAELKDDLSGIKPETLKECISATEDWENVDKDKWTVVEGPTVIKDGQLYYLFYSANHFRSKGYAVGYAVSKNPGGPWVKHSGNPIISMKNIGHSGSGHGDIFQASDGTFKYVLHTHNSEDKIAPRLTGIVDLQVTGKGKKKRFSTIKNSFRFLRGSSAN